MPTPAMPQAEDEAVAEALDALLAEVVTDDGYVDYRALAERRGPLDDYVGMLSRPYTRKLRNVRHPFWLNAYVALTLFQVIERGDLSSITEVDGWLPGPSAGFLYETDFNVDGHRISLGEIKQERLRGRTLDLRDFSVFNDATRGGPPVRQGLYRHKRVGRDLDKQMRAWVNDPARGVRLGSDGTAEFNMIFKWYEHDFMFWTAGENLCTVAAHYADAPLRKDLLYLADLDCPHRFYAYDWSLNQAP